MGTFRCDGRVEPMRDVDLAHLELTIVDMLLEHGTAVVTVVDDDGRNPARYVIAAGSPLQFERDAHVELDGHRIAIMRAAARDQAGIVAPRAA